MTALAWGIAFAAVACCETALVIHVGNSHATTEASGKMGALIFGGFIIVSIITLIRNP